ncbi:terminase small subunit [Sphingobium sp.]|uniref:terminase small subunit n=1 Tax=Sphingobium sp. TaxID=1912891 RepID=UPI00257D504C|nr:terminase small subunit [Sphingobium sp.]
MNDKQLRFAQEYLIDLNATQAAIRAGYSAKTASSQGERLLRNVEVQRAVAEAKAARSEKTGIDAAWVLSRLAAEAFADLADLYDEDGRVKPVKDWPLVWRQGLVAGIEVETIGEGAGHVTKVKISERIKRVELIGKHVDVQAFKEKLEVAAAMTLVIDPKDAAL